VQQLHKIRKLPNTQFSKWWGSNTQSGINSLQQNRVFLKTFEPDLLAGIYSRILAALLEGIYSRILAALLEEIYSRTLASPCWREFIPESLPAPAGGNLFPNPCRPAGRNLFPNPCQPLLEGIYSRIPASPAGGNLFPNPCQPCWKEFIPESLPALLEGIYSRILAALLEGIYSRILASPVGGNLFPNPCRIGKIVPFRRLFHCLYPANLWIRWYVCRRQPCRINQDSALCVKGVIHNPAVSIMSPRPLMIVVRYLPTGHWQ
jgi:hypothetical protein